MGPKLGALSDGLVGLCTGPALGSGKILDKNLGNHELSNVIFYYRSLLDFLKSEEASYLLRS